MAYIILDKATRRFFSVCENEDTELFSELRAFAEKDDKSKKAEAKEKSSKWKELAAKAKDPETRKKYLKNAAKWAAIAAGTVLVAKAAIDTHNTLQDHEQRITNTAGQVRENTDYIGKQYGRAPRSDQKGYLKEGGGNWYHMKGGHVDYGLDDTGRSDKFDTEGRDVEWTNDSEIKK